MPPSTSDSPASTATLPGNAQPIPAGEPPTLAGLVGYLRAEGVSDLYLPERLEVVEAMPRTATGKIRKVELRERFGDAPR